MIKKIVVTIGVLAVCCIGSYAFAQTVVDMGDGTGSAGSTGKEVPVTISGIPAGNVTGIDIWFSYNASALDLTDVDSTGTLTQGWEAEATPSAAEMANLTAPWHYPVYNDNPKGTVKVALYGTTPINNSGTLAKLIFSVKSAAVAGQVPLLLTKGQLNEGQVASTLSNGAFTVTAGSGLRGDVNSDGAIDIGDVLSVVAHIFGNANYGAAADANIDGSVDIGDVMTVVNLIFAG
jgi:hypothetical protein